jgi:hypothetical protein
VLADGFDKEIFEGGAVAALAEFVEGAFGDEAAFVDDGDAVAEAFDDFENVGGEKDGGAALDEIEEEFFHEAGADGIDAFEGFIHEKELGTVDEGSGHGDAFAHALGVFGDEFAAGAGEFEEIDEFLGAFEGDGAWEAVETADELEVFRASEIVEEEGLIGDEADALAGAEAGFGLVGVDGLAEEEHLTGGGLSYAHEHFDGSGFACAIGPEEAVETALRNRKAQAIDGGFWAVAFAEMSGFYS